MTCGVDSYPVTPAGGSDGEHPFTFRPHGARLYITEVAVAKGCRRQGVGMALLQAAENVARSGYAPPAAESGAINRDVERGPALYLHVQAGNLGARGLYERAGFRAVGKRSLSALEAASVAHGGDAPQIVAAIRRSIAEMTAAAISGASAATAAATDIDSGATDEFGSNLDEAPLKEQAIALRFEKGLGLKGSHVLMVKEL